MIETVSQEHVNPAASLEAVSLLSLCCDSTRSASYLQTPSTDSLRPPTERKPNGPGVM